MMNRPEPSLVTVLERPRCRIPFGEADDDAFDWKNVAALPAMVSLLPATEPLPATEVRAVAGERELVVRFDCAVDDMKKLAPRIPSAPLSESEHVMIEIAPGNDPTQRIRFLAEYRGMREANRLSLVNGEARPEAAFDVWQESGRFAGDWRRFHGITGRSWFLEFIIPWKSLGRTARPSTIGLAYGRSFKQTAYLGPYQTVAVGWPEGKRASNCAPNLEPAEAMIGPNAGAPQQLKLAVPRFGRNTARLVLGNAWPSPPQKLRASSLDPDGKPFALSESAIDKGRESVEFAFDLDRAHSSHAEPFKPQKLLLEVLGANDAILYRALLPMDRYLGMCVDEPFGENVTTGNDVRSRSLQRVIAKLPRLHRRNTTHGAPSDFCLCVPDGTVAVNLVADDAWARLAAIVEDRFVSAEDRLLGAMALVGQKSVMNLVCVPLFQNAKGQQSYHTPLHEMMGPLSLLRYGGGTAMSLAAVLARLLNSVRDPATGKPFTTRAVSLTRDGGPRQVARKYDGCGGVAPFVQQPGPVAAVAVDYRGSQTLLDPSALAFFPKSETQLATVEEIVADESLRVTGAGRLAPLYAGLDIEEMRRHRPNRLLSKGVFPELFPDEDRLDRPFDPASRQVLRVLTCPKGTHASFSGGFVDGDGGNGVRDGSVAVFWDDRVLRVRALVRGIKLSVLDPRDREMERVHVAIDAGHGHSEFHHFQATWKGDRGAWRESAGGIQTFCKHLSTENWSEDAVLGNAGWSAACSEAGDQYTVEFEIAWNVLGIDSPAEIPPSIGLNVWIDHRAPHYGQVFLAPPRWRLEADPFSFADVYLGDSPVQVPVIDFGLVTWGDNTARVTLVNTGPRGVTVSLRTDTRLCMRRKRHRRGPVGVLVPAIGRVEAEFPFYVDPEEKMTTTGGQTMTLEAVVDGRVVSRASWSLTYCSTVSVFQRYGSDLGESPNPTPGEADYLNKKIRHICSRIPKFQRLTTRDGAPSDFFLRAEDGSVEFNLMEEGAFDKMATYIDRRFDNDLDRALGLFYLGYHPAILRHMSGGHRLMDGCGPLSVMRGNFAGGGGNCGFHSRAFGGMAAHVKRNGKYLAGHTLGVYGHVISAMEWGNSKALLDADVGHILLSPDGASLATLDEFRELGAVLTTAGPGDLARYFSFHLESTRRQRRVDENNFGGVFPAGAPRQ